MRRRHQHLFEPYCSFAPHSE